jgi:hypothetical protein
LSNIPTGITEEQMLEIFKEHKIVEFKFFQSVYFHLNHEHEFMQISHEQERPQNGVGPDGGHRLGCGLSDRHACLS